jgi:hypothetical protein
MKIEAFGERQTLSLKPRIHRPRLGGLMFGRKKKEQDVDGVSCPYCGHLNPVGSEHCEQCYYSLNKSARDQPMAEPTTSEDEIMSLLLGENEEEEEVGPVVEAVLSLDDVTVEVDQYAVSEPKHGEDGEPVPDSFDFIDGEGPTLSSTVASQEPEDVELTVEDAPKKYIEFELSNADPLDEVADPVHTGRGGLYSPAVSTPTDDDLLGEVGPTANTVPDLPDLPPDEISPSGTLAQAAASETPALPDLTDLDVGPIPEKPPASQPLAAQDETPELPDLAEDESNEAMPTTQSVEAEPLPAESPDQPRIWPWPKGDAWAPTQVYQEVVAAMDHVKHRRMEEAAATLDGLGPHLDHHLDMLLHVSVLMHHLGRQEHMKWTLDMAAYVHPNDPHVQQARAQLLA